MPGFEQLWFNRAENLREAAEELVVKALRAAGWKHTSQTPGSVWMWEKQIEGISYRVGVEDAARIQEHFDRTDYFKAYPDELGD
jgi:DNA polymerase/3'-5' exonuclease PolX